MNKLKIAILAALSAVAITSVASAQVLGTRYVGANVAYNEIDAGWYEPDGWSYGAVINLPAGQTANGGYDISIGISTGSLEQDPFGEAPAIDDDSTDLRIGGVYYHNVNESVRPFVGLHAGHLWQDGLGGSDRSFYAGVSAGLEYIIAEQISVLAGVRYELIERTDDDPFTYFAEANYWINESFGAAIGVSYSEEGDAEAFSYGISLRYRL